MVMHVVLQCRNHKLGFPGGSVGKESACNAGDPDSISGLGRSPGEGKATHSSILAWPGEFYGLYSPWGSKESDTTDNFCFQSRFGIIYIYIYTHTHFVFIEI